MSDIASIAPLPVWRPGAPGAPGAAGGGGFGQTLRQALDQVNGLQAAADRATEAYSLGRTRDVAGTLIAIEEATLAFQLTLQIRNKLVEAYQEVMRMSM